MNLRSVRTGFLLERKRERKGGRREYRGHTVHKIYSGPKFAPNKGNKKKIYLLILSSMGTGAPHQNIKVHVLILCTSCHYLIAIIGFLFLLKSGHLLSK